MAKVAKSIRLSSEILEVVESVPVKGFANKIEYIVFNWKKEEPELKKRLDYYDKQIQKRQKQLERISQQVQSLDITIQAIFSLQDEVHRLQKQIADIFDDS